MESSWEVVVEGPKLWLVLRLLQAPAPVYVEVTVELQEVTSYIEFEYYYFWDIEMGDQALAFHWHLCDLIPWYTKLLQVIGTINKMYNASAESGLSGWHHILATVFTCTCHEKQ